MRTHWHRFNESPLRFNQGKQGEIGSETDLNIRIEPTGRRETPKGEKWTSPVAAKSTGLFIVSIQFRMLNSAPANLVNDETIYAAEYPRFSAELKPLHASCLIGRSRQAIPERPRR
jgi:hypothetical protein